MSFVADFIKPVAKPLLGALGLGAGAAAATKAFGGTERDERQQQLTTFRAPMFPQFVTSRGTRLFSGQTAPRAFLGGTTSPVSTILPDGTTQVSGLNKTFFSGFGPRPTADPGFLGRSPVGEPLQVGVDVAPVAAGLRDEAAARTRGLIPLVQQERQGILGDIDALRQGFAETPGLFESTISDIRRTREDLRGARNPFIEARTRPLTDLLQQQVAQQRSGFARRGVFGPLASNVIGQTQARGVREIADQRSLALQESLGAEMASIGQELQARGVETQRLGTFAGALTQALDSSLRRMGLLDQFNARLASIGQQELQAELAAAGLAQNVINQILASRVPSSVTTTGTAQVQQPLQDFGGLISGIGLLGSGITSGDGLFGRSSTNMP